ncbi:MAG: CvpA family protein [Firmicutes bacterium]|nr:CvpA family protein [Bacillota bacterium]
MRHLKKLTGPWRTVLNIGVTLIFGLIYYYFALPALNFQDPSLYTFVILLAAVFCLLSIATRGLLRQGKRGRELWIDIKKNCLWPVLLVAALIVVYLLGNLISAPIFRATAYRDLLTVNTGDFATDVKEVNFDQIPMLDKDSAQRLGDRKMGNLPDLVSQFEVADDYTQINYQGGPVRVTYLQYGDFFKWFNNRANGLPAYITVNMVTQEANVVRLSDLGLGGIKYSPSEYFFRKLDRHLRFAYPTFMFDPPTFEIDDSGVPYWICPRVVKTIGLFGGTDISGAVLCNAVTGQCQYYAKDDVPAWVDRVYLADLIVQQYNYHGKYIHGFWNSLFGQKDVTEAADGYNYLAMNDSVYMYAGVTSVTSDQSNLGFILCNQRTKECTFYSAPGAVESSAQASAEGVVQDQHYTATFPLLLNVADNPTYFMSLKDDSQLVKQYAMVNVAQYQIVATGATVADCQANYLKLLSTHNLASLDNSADLTISGTIAELRSAVIDGNTEVYLRLEGDSFYYVLSVKDNELAAVLNVGDTVSLLTTIAEGDLRPAMNLERTAVAP